MSSEELTSIEKNGNYWLSKSNTAYHIINPNASDLSVIEEIGNFSLGKSDNQYYILDPNGNSIRFDTPKYSPGYSYTDTPLQVEEALDYVGFQNNFPNGVFWVLYQREEWIDLKVKTYNKGYMALKYDETGGGNKGTDLILKLDRFGNETSESVYRPYIDYEAMFGVDLNNDGIIASGINPNNLMDISGNKHHLDDGHGSDSIIIKNVTIDPNSNGGLNATQVQKNGDHYELLLEHTNVKYDVWKVDASGNFVSSIKAKLWEDEEKFSDALDEHGDKIKVDINGDGDTGLVTVEAIGSVHLKHGDNTYNGAPQYYIVDGTDAPIALTVGGVSRGPTSYAGGSATQVIANASGGYDILWDYGSKYDVWKVDASGNFVSRIKAKLWEDEVKFGFDINGDSDTGLVAVEAIGSVHLKHGDNTYNGAPQYYIVDGTDAPIALTVGGVSRGPTSYAGGSATQVIANASGGYDILWDYGSKYDVWKVDASGNFVSRIKAKLWEDEVKFGFDINGDSDTGLVAVEAIGSVHLKHGDNTYNGATQYYIVDGTDAPIALTVGGVSRGPTSYAGGSATQVIANASGGYDILWDYGSKYDVWKVDASGNFVSRIKAKLWEDEVKFGFDINGDSDTGLVAVEAIGSVHLKHGDNTYNGATQYYIVDGTDAPIALTVGGVSRGPTSYAGGSATQVIANASGGYDILWDYGSKYDVWKVDASGNFVSRIKAKLWEDEVKFGFDINGDSDTGLVAVEAIGSVHLKHGDNTYNGATQYYIVDGTDAPIALTVGGVSRGPTSYAGGSATQVIANASGGYDILWDYGSKYDVWKVDASGNFVSRIKAKLWEDEVKFGVDINGDGSGAGKNIIYGVGNDDIYGSIGHDTFDGGAGDDTINGREGHDKLIGGDGDDTISGDGGSGYAGNDILYGNGGNDDLRGRDGNDILDGGTGKDIIATGSGSDTIYLRIGDGGNALSDADIITDFTDGSDDFGLTTSLSFGDLTRTQGSGDYANDTIIKYGTEYLAILQNIDVSLLTEADFEDVDIA